MLKRAAATSWGGTGRTASLKRWRDGQMVEASKQFRRVNGHMHLRSLRDALKKVTQPVGAAVHSDSDTAA